MVNKADKNEARLRRHRRVRGKISGTAERPRLNVFRSSKHIYAQIIDDTTGNQVGKNIAKKALEKGISEVVYDRGGFVYHGRVQALAEGAREGGLKL